MTATLNNGFEAVLGIRIWICRVGMFLGLPDPHPDPLARGTDPRIRIRIRTKILLIPNTGLKSSHTSYKSCRKFKKNAVFNP